MSGITLTRDASASKKIFLRIHMFSFVGEHKCKIKHLGGNWTGKLFIMSTHYNFFWNFMQTLIFFEEIEIHLFFMENANVRLNIREENGSNNYFLCSHIETSFENAKFFCCCKKSIWLDSKAFWIKDKYVFEMHSVAIEGNIHLLKRIQLGNWTRLLFFVHTLKSRFMKCISEGVTLVDYSIFMRKLRSW